MQELKVHPTAVIDPGVVLESDVHIWHFCHVREGAYLESGVSLGKDVYIDRNVRVGKRSRIQNGVSVYQGIQIASYCFVGPHVIFTNDISPRVGVHNWEVIETHLNTGCSIGAGAIIRCGVTLGSFCTVGAGAIVTKSVPAFHIAMGFPAQSLQMVCACAKTHLPLETPQKELIRDCCKKNLEIEILEAAEKALTKND